MPLQTLAALREGPKGRVPEVRNAYRYLRGAHESAVRLFLLLNDAVLTRRASNSENRGRMATEEVDLLRSVIVFTSSGLDASMSKLINDAGRYLLKVPSSGARGQYRSFLQQQMASAKIDSDLKNAVTSPNPTRQLMSYYLSVKSRASFQGSGDLRTRVRDCLGIPSTRVTDEQLQQLDGFFQARNSIVHDMDYENVERSDTRRRHHRTSVEVSHLCNGAFRVGSELIHGAAEVIIATR